MPVSRGLCTQPGFAAVRTPNALSSSVDEIRIKNYYCSRLSEPVEIPFLSHGSVSLLQRVNMFFEGCKPVCAAGEFSKRTTRSILPATRTTLRNGRKILIVQCFCSRIAKQMSLAAATKSVFVVCGHSELIIDTVEARLSIFVFWPVMPLAGSAAASLVKA